MISYYLDMDDDGHWYLVPTKKKEDWEQWVKDYVAFYEGEGYGEYDEEHAPEPERPEGIKDVGDPHIVKFYLVEDVDGR